MAVLSVLGISGRLHTQWTHYPVLGPNSQLYDGSSQVR